MIRLRFLSRILCAVPLLLLLSGCISTVVGVAAGTAIGVVATVVTVPIKVGEAVVGAFSDNDDTEDKDNDNDKDAD